MRVSLLVINMIVLLDPAGSYSAHGGKDKPCKAGDLQKNPLHFNDLFQQILLGLIKNEPMMLNLAAHRE
jgi:hypothetical protein